MSDTETRTVRTRAFFRAFELSNFTLREIGQASGVYVSTINRWVSDERPTGSTPNEQCLFAVESAFIKLANERVKALNSALKLIKERKTTHGA